MKYYIGIDDTDNATSRGTGWLARQLSAGLKQFGKIEGVTRHQFLVHPNIPYTSHNSGACIGLNAESGEDRERIIVFSREFLLEKCAVGSDPGLCVAIRHQLEGDPLKFSRSAQETILMMSEAESVAAAAGIYLEPLGGTGEGIIGALSAAALRADGNDGRFILIGNSREVGNTVRLSEILGRCADRALDENGDEVHPDAMITTNGRVRPELVGGIATLKLKTINKKELIYETHGKSH